MWGVKKIQKVKEEKGVGLRVCALFEDLATPG